MLDLRAACESSFTCTSEAQTIFISLELTFHFFLFTFHSPTFDFDVDACRKVERHKCVDGALGRVHNVDETFVNAHLVLVTRRLVDERCAVHRVATTLSWERHWTDNCCTGTFCRLNDRFCRRVDDLVVIGADTDTNALLLYSFLSCGDFLCPSYAGKERWKRRATSLSRHGSPTFITR